VYVELEPFSSLIQGLGISVDDSWDEIVDKARNGLDLFVSPFIALFLSKLSWSETALHNTYYLVIEETPSIPC
jgi:hypothetical protein